MTSDNLRELVHEILSTREMQKSLNTPQLKHSSVEQAGNITVREPVFDQYGNPSVNEDGIQEFREALQMGMQWDGSYASAPLTQGQLPPPQPQAPEVIPVPSGLVIKWNGEYLDSLFSPMNFSRVETHLGDRIDFSAEFADTIVGTTSSPRASYVVAQGLSDQQQYYAKLVARDLAGGRGPFSPATGATPLAPASEAATQAAIDAAVTGIRAEVAVVADSAAKADAKAGAAQTTANGAKAASEAATAAAAAAKAEAKKAYDEAVLAIGKGTTAENKAQVAIDAASGKNKITYSTANPPSSYVGMPGDTWWQRNASTGNLDRAWEWSGTAWTARKMTDQMIDTLSVGKLTSGTLGVGVYLTTGSVSGNHARLGNSALTIYKVVDSEMGPQPTVNIGGSGSDVVQVLDPTENVMYGFDSTGQATFGDTAVSSLTVAGSEVTDLLSVGARGFCAGYRAAVDTPKIGQNKELGVCEVAYPLEPYRLYKVKFSGNFYASAAGTARLFIRHNRTGQAPTLANTTQLRMGFYPVVVGGNHLEIETFIFGNTNGVPARFLLSMQMAIGTGMIHFIADGGNTPGYFTVEDVGQIPGDSSQVWSAGSMTSGNMIPTSGTAQVAPVTGTTNYTRTYTASWSRTWRDAAVESTNELRQGRWNNQFRSAFGFPSGMTSDLSGARITGMQVYLYSNHWYSSAGGYASIGVHANTSHPASFPSSTVFTSPKFGTGGRWIPVPSNLWQGFANGAYRGFTLGGNGSASRDFYGRFQGVGADMKYPPQVRFNYTR